MRCHLHFETGREQDVLRFDLQPPVARRMGFVAGSEEQGGLKPVERFMKRYFLAAREVGELTRILCAELEEEDAKAAPVLDRIGLSLPGLGEVSLGSAKRAITHRAKAISGTKDFVARRGRIDVADDAVFERDPVKLVEIFAVAEREGLLFHPGCAAPHPPLAQARDEGGARGPARRRGLHVRAPVATRPGKVTCAR